MDKSQQAYSEWYRECAGQPNELRVIWDAAWQASRKQTLEEAERKCFEVFDESPATSMEQVRHNQGVRKCIDAIRSLEGDGLGQKAEGKST